MSERGIDGLYQGALADFTPARNALAKAAGKGGAAIKALAKPSAPAWAVNQLFWRERRTYDRLIRASERLRAAHAQVMRGKKLDMRPLEAQHGAAVKEASGRVAAILVRSGDPATPATLKAVLDTLQALPGPDVPGRLTRALAPIGFGAFGALMKASRGAPGAKAIAEVVTFAPPKPKPDEAAEAAKRLAAINARRLKELDAVFAGAMRALVGARARLARADKAKAAAEASLQKAQALAERQRADVARLERGARAADQERSALKADSRK